MKLEHSFVVPVPLADARRLVRDFAARAPAVPGCSLRIGLAPLDERSTTVKVVGTVRASGGLRSALAAEAGLRMLRRLVRSFAAEARAAGGPPGGRRGAPEDVWSAATTPAGAPGAGPDDEEGELGGAGGGVSGP
jgi:hypothetical protein